MSDLFTSIQQAFHDAFDIDPQLVSMDTVPDDIPGWDSVGHLTLANSLESIFEVSFDVDELMEMENVREIVRIVQSKRNHA
ncbi:MAG: phosphopantetheine-binding protein [Syntrophobacteraceae bacterium]